MIAYCGLDCEGCPIRQATLATDRALQRSMRIEIARQCTEHYGIPMLAEDVTDCDGCRSENGRIFKGCINCLIRRCVLGRRLESCALCPEYACDPLRKHFETDPVSRTRLDALRGERAGRDPV
jgi:hypothetical protein